MICKLDDEGFHIFEKKTGMTAHLSGKELLILKDNCIKNNYNEFIDRLLYLGILIDFNKDTREKIYNTIEGQKVFSPQAVHIELTDNCPFDCPQCYKKNTLNNTKSSIEIDLFKNYIEQSEKNRVFQISLGGGEPMIYENIEKAVELVGKTGMSCNITTSGYNVNKNTILKMKNMGLTHVQISLNSVDKKKNEKSRQGYDYALNALKVLSVSNISFGINYVARKDSLSSFEEIVKLGISLGADNINVLRYKPVFYENYNQNSLTYDENKKLADMIIKTKGIKIKVDSANSMLLFYLYGNNINNLFCGCGAGKNFMAISADGGFKVCSHAEKKEYFKSIKKWWSDSSELLKIRNADYYKNSICSSCIYVKKCRSCKLIKETNCIAYKKE